MDVQIQKEQQSPVEYQLQVTVPAELMASRIKSEMDKMAANIRLPGFRPGHIPRRVLVEKFGRAVTQDVLQEVLQEAYRDALEQAALNAVSPGEMSDVQYEQGNPLTFVVKVEVAPEINVPPLSEITVEQLEPTVEDEEVMRALEELREGHAVVVPTDDPVGPDSVITVDLQELDKSGLPIVGRAQKGMQIDLSRSQLGEEFNARMMGLTNDRKTVVEFPARGSTEQEPQTVRYEVHVRNVQKKELPPLDDELARTVNPQLHSLDDLKADIRRYMEARAQHAARERMFRAIADELLRRTDFPVPPRMLDDYLDRLAADALRQHGHEHTPEVEAREIEKFKEDYRASAIWSLRWHLVRKKLIEERGLDVPDDEFQAELERQAQIDGTSLAEFRKKLTAEQRSRIREDLLERKVLGVLSSEVQMVPRPVSLAEFEGRTPGRVVTV